jgi:hypothetical protein
MSFGFCSPSKQETVRAFQLSQARRRVLSSWSDALNRFPEFYLMSRRLAFLIALALSAAPLHAQSHPLVGEWSVSLAVGLRNENGVETPIMQTGSMTIVSQGDSLIATTKMQPPEGMPARPPSRMAGKVGAGPVVFVLTSAANININGEVTVRTAVSTFTLTATGDAMSGTLARAIEGLEMPSTPQPVTGSRVKK